MMTYDNISTFVLTFTTFLRFINLSLPSSTFDLSSKSYLDISATNLFTYINNFYSLTNTYGNILTTNFLPGVN